MNGLEGLFAGLYKFISIKVRMGKCFFEFLQHIIAMPLFTVEMEQKKIQRYGRFTGISIIAIVFFNSSDQFLPEIVGFGFLAIAQAPGRPGFDGVTGAPPDFSILTAVGIFQSLNKCTGGRRSGFPASQLQGTQTG